ncbi:unnamed protein product [Arabidopsis arenosa]|uniref:Uncharacterized protein n=1 Tax=Arabidopsis arenosa TaxID=38785 RepID=A0A8S2AKY4_ARAAE|nr:unnamed protein product [Arabidopsis arenosa]
MVRSSGIWAIEAIPLIGPLLGEKLNKELGAVPRCSNWKGQQRTLSSPTFPLLEILIYLNIEIGVLEEEKIEQPLEENNYVEGQTETDVDDKEAADVTDGDNIVSGLQSRHKEQPTCSKKRKKETDRGAESRKMRLLY